MTFWQLAHCAKISVPFALTLDEAMTMPGIVTTCATVDASISRIVIGCLEEVRVTWARERGGRGISGGALLQHARGRVSEEKKGERRQRCSRNASRRAPGRVPRKCLGSACTWI